MTQEFVPYEQALELKELGFDEPCITFYPKEDKMGFNGKYHSIKEGYKNSTVNDIWIKRYKKDFECVAAPTYSQCFRWFRENYNLVYQINYLYNGNYQVVILKNTHEYMELIQDLEYACVDEIPDNYSYEEAELVCIIKLIEIVKNK